MKNFFKIALAGAALSAAVLSTPAAAYSLSFFMTGVPITEGIYTYTYVSSDAGLQNYAAGGKGAVFITETVNGPFEKSSFQLADFAGLNSRAEATYFLSYTVEIYAAAPNSNPDIRLQQIGLGADVNSGSGNIGTSKEIVGQVTPIVPSPTFDETINTTPSSLASTVNCGVCRKFLVTDTITMQYVGGNPRGIINGMSNSYDTEPLPEPATLALFGLGLAGLGARNLRRKNKAA